MFSLSVAGFFYENKISNTIKEIEPKIALLIPAYKENEVIIDTAKKACLHNYSNFEVIIIADSLNDTTLNELRKLNIKLIEVSFKKSTKAKALNYTLSILKDDYQIAVVLDADLVMLTLYTCLLCFLDAIPLNQCIIKIETVSIITNY